MSSALCPAVDDGFDAAPSTAELAREAAWGSGVGGAPSRAARWPLALSPQEVAALQGAGMIVTAAGRGSYHVTVPNAVPPPAGGGRAFNPAAGFRRA